MSDECNAWMSVRVSELAGIASTAALFLNLLGAGASSESESE